MATYIPKSGRNFDLRDDANLRDDAAQKYYWSEFKNDVVNNVKALSKIPKGIGDEAFVYMGFAKAISNQSPKEIENNYNPFSDPQLIPYSEHMGFFLKSQSRQDTKSRINTLINNHKEYYDSPLYWTGRVMGGFVDPVSLFLFTPLGKFALTGSKLSRMSKFGGAIAGEEMAKQYLDPNRTIQEGMIITGAGFVLPLMFPSAAKNPKAYQAFKKFDEEADFLDDVDAIKSSQKTDNTFLSGSVGAAQINEVFTENQLQKLNQLAKTYTGWEKLDTTPIQRMLKSKNLDAQDIIEELLEVSLLQNKNFMKHEYAGTTKQAIETTVEVEKRNIFFAQDEIQQSYLQYLKSKNKKPPLKGLSIGLDLQKGSDDLLSFEDFKNGMYKSMLGLEDDITNIPEIARAVKATKKYVFDYYGKQYSDLNLPVIYSERLKFIYQDQLRKGWRRATPQELKDNPESFMYNLSELEIKNLKEQIKILQERITYIKEHSALKKNFIPRIALRDQIESRFGEFSLLMTRAIMNYEKKFPAAKKLSPKEVEGLIESYRTAQPFVKMEDVYGDGPAKMSISRHFMARTINILPEDELKIAQAGFFETDIMILQRLYFNSVVPDIEITKVFGDPMASGFQFATKGIGRPGMHKIWSDFEKKINELNPTKESVNKLSPQLQKKIDKLLNERDIIIRDLEAARDLIRGSYGLADDPQRSFSRGIRIMKQWNSWTMLTGTLAAFPDLARVLSTSGIERGFRTSLDILFNGLDKETRKLIMKQTNLAGEGLDLAFSSRALSMYDLENAFGVFSKLEKATSKTSSIYFTYINMMNGWNTLMKGWASVVNGTRIIEVAEEWVTKGKISKVNLAKMQNAGINKESARVIWEQYQKHGLGPKAKKADWKESRLAQIDEWDDEARAVGEIFNKALSKDLRMTIVTPSKGEVPLWFNTELGGVVVQFKKFAWAATNKMMMRGLQEKDMNFLGGLLLLLAAGATVDSIRTNAFDRSYRKKPFGDKLVNAFDRSGIAGILGDVNNVIERATDNTIGFRPMLGAGRPYSSYTTKNFMQGFGVLGPTSSQIGTIQDIMFDWGKGTHNHYTARNVRRLIPFQNIWYADKLFDQVEKGLRF